MQDYGSLKGLEMLLFDQDEMQIFVYHLLFSERKAHFFYPYSYRFADVLRIVTKNSCIGDLYSVKRAKKKAFNENRPVLYRN